MAKERLIKPTVKVNSQSCRYRPPLPDGFVISIDTREQKPYKFKDIPTILHKLDFGDYACKGCENSMAIERKSQGDFYGSITNGRLRFKRMLKRMQIAILLDAHNRHVGMVTFKDLLDEIAGE